MEEDTEQELLLETDSDEEISYDSGTDIDTTSGYDKDSATAGCASESQVYVCSTLGILVVSILLLEVPVD
jgi:hypothetical protein